MKNYLIEYLNKLFLLKTEIYGFVTMSWVWLTRNRRCSLRLIKVVVNDKISQLAK